MTVPKLNQGIARGQYQTQAKRLYAQRRAEGICARCGKFDAVPGKAQCVDCTAYQHEYERTRVRPTGERRRVPPERIVSWRPLLTELPAPSRPLSVERETGIKRDYLTIGVAPQNLALQLIWAMKREEAQRALQAGREER